jgi:hypothetical protein
MFVVDRFPKVADIPFGLARIFESLLPRQIGANRRENRSIQVLITKLIKRIDISNTSGLVKNLISDYGYSYWLEVPSGSSTVKSIQS